MSFDKSKPYQECLGGVLHGCFLQGDQHYGPDGEPVDLNRNKVVVPEKKADPKKEPEKKGVLDEQMKD